jgi:hypothetical protein
MELRREHDALGTRISVTVSGKQSHTIIASIAGSGKNRRVEFSWGSAYKPLSLVDTLAWRNALTMLITEATAVRDRLSDAAQPEAVSKPIQKKPIQKKPARPPLAASRKMPGKKIKKRRK